MTEAEYLEAVDACCQDAAGGGPEWNRLFTAALERRGLKLIPIDHVLGKAHYVQAPYPFSEGQPQWVDSWIVEADGVA